jgi:hypothetical protein
MGEVDQCEISPTEGQLGRGGGSIELPLRPYHQQYLAKNPGGYCGIGGTGGVLPDRCGEVGRRAGHHVATRALDCSPSNLRS